MSYKIGDHVYVKNQSNYLKKVIIDKGYSEKESFYLCSINEYGHPTGPYEFVYSSEITPADVLTNSNVASIPTETVLSFEPAPMTRQCTHYADRKNDGKPQLTLLPFDCLAECAKVMMQAKSKYPDQANGKANWEKLWGKDTLKVTLDSALRHITARLSGEVKDKESGQLHAAHAAVNLLFLIRYELEEATK